MKLFGVMLAVVVLVGALVGAVVGVLLPKISTGLSLGVLCSLYIGVVISSLLNFDLVMRRLTSQIGVSKFFCIHNLVGYIWF